MSASGFTLVEMMVIITIVTIFTIITARALPIVRNQQNVRLAQQQISSLLNEARHQALNETRQDACLESHGQSEKKCSDIGLDLRQTTATLFADTDDDNRFSARDFIIRQQPIAGSMTALTPTTALFEASPPSVVMYGNGALKAPGDSSLTLILESGGDQKNYLIDSYGHLEQQ